MTESAPEKVEALVLDLNFVPVWARKPPESRPFTGTADEGHDRGGEREGFRRHQRPDRAERPDRRQGGGGGRRPNFRDRQRGEMPSPRVVAEPVDERLASLEVAFLPERRGLAPLAGRFAKSCRAYSLFEVASLFLSKPDYYLIKIEVPASQASLSLFQCTECKAVFLDRAAAASHVFSAHFEKFCRKEERETEPPKGNFVCVARCGLSGVLLGPPNYHGYNDKVAEIHRTRYPDMPLEAYRQRIETLHDATAIEQWKESMRKQVVYHFGHGEQAVSFNRFSEAESYFRDHSLAETVKESKSVMVPGAIAHAMEAGPLRRVIEEAWNRESRFPLKLSIILRLAFRHLGLHTFKAAGGHTFVTAVAPAPIEPAHAVEGVREILDFIAAKPGCTPSEMIAALNPAAPPAPAEGAETPPVPAASSREHDLKRQLQWLVAKGHVIEFSDGRMAIPTAAVAKVQMARPKGGAGKDKRRRAQ